MGCVPLLLLNLQEQIFPTSHTQSTVGRSGLPSRRIDFLACSDSAPVPASGTFPDFSTETFYHIPVYAVMRLSASYFFADPRSPPHARFTWDRFALRDRQHRVLFNDRIASSFSNFSNVPPDPERVWDDFVSNLHAAALPEFRCRVQVGETFQASHELRASLREKKYAWSLYQTALRLGDANTAELLSDYRDLKQKTQRDLRRERKAANSSKIKEALDLPDPGQRTHVLYKV